MPNYARLAASARRQITAAGVSVTLKRDRLDDYDPTQGTAELFGSTSFTGKAVRDQYNIKDVDGTLIRSGDVKLYLVWDDEDPNMQTGEQITTGDGEVWKVVKPNPVKPGPVVLLYEVQARKP